MNLEQHPDWNPPKVDKRTRSYKEYKEAFEKKHANDSKGLGDTIEKITEATGIKSLVKFVAGEDCGCDKRKENLNEKFKYKFLECPTEEMYNFMHDYFSKPHRSDITGQQQDMFNSILRHVFKRKFPRVSCCYGGRLNEVKKLYLEYSE